MDETINEIKEVIAYYSGYLDSLNLPKDFEEAKHTARKIDVLRSAVAVLRVFSKETEDYESM